MKTFRIALYPGDGIGPEVIDEAVRVLEFVSARFELRLEMTRFDWGVDYHARHGVVAPPNYLELLRPFDAILLGALGMPSQLPDHITLEPLVQLRQRFDLFACVRPAMLFPGIASPLAKPGPIDMVVIRENSEGEYVRCGGRFKTETPQEVSIQTSIHTRAGVKRILRFGFDLARTRRRRLTMITKSNAMQFSMVMWDEILQRLRQDHPDVEVDRMHVDAAAMNFVRKPETFDVVVASNLFGDILTDLAAAIVGGIGLCSSANINPTREFPSMFEPVHGSAPDIVGKNIANPTAAIQSAAMMLQWLGASDPANQIRIAVQEALRKGHTTPDLGGNLTTVQMTDQILDELKRLG